MLSRQSRHRWRTRCIHRRSRGGERPQRVLVGIDAEMLEDVNMRELPHHRVVRRRCAADADAQHAAARRLVIPGPGSGAGARRMQARVAVPSPRRPPPGAGPPAACEQAHTHWPTAARHARGGGWRHLAAGRLQLLHNLPAVPAAPHAHLCARVPAAPPLPQALRENWAGKFAKKVRDLNLFRHGPTNNAYAYYAPGHPCPRVPARW